MNVNFLAAWSLSAVALAVLACYAGVRAGQGPFGILVDNRGRFSLNRFQLVCWTLAILSSFLGVFLAGSIAEGVPKLSPTLLGLMGISVGSALLSGTVKAAKDTAGAAIPRFSPPPKSGAPAASPVRRFWQILLEEEGPNADKIVSVTKFQNFIFTVALLVLYIVTVSNTNGVALPTFDSESVLWLLGISHAGYIGGKIPNRS
jgi:hypothetical protein